MNCYIIGLNNMKISDSASRSIFLKSFDRNRQKFDLVSADRIPESHQISLLRKVANADDQLLPTWTAVETIISKNSPDIVITYMESLEYLVSHEEKLDKSSTNNSGQKTNIVETNFMDAYIPEDIYYE